MVKFTVIIVGNKALDWPKNMPIPSKGDVVTIEDLQCKQHTGTVDKVHYLVTKSLIEIRIETDPID